MDKSAFQVIGEGDVVVGRNTSISPTAQIIFHRPASVVIGDYCSIGPGVKFVVDGGPVTIGDWTTLHDQCLVLSTQGVQIGQHGWFGQNTVLDGSGGLTIGNGVRVGMYSQIWSHVAAGEQIEGCTLFGQRPVVIEDDVWLVGSCICASGITIGRRTVALINSNITRSWPEEVVLAGSPAKQKSLLSFYKPVTLDEKWAMLRGWLDELVPTLGIAALDGPTDRVMAYRWADPERAGEIIAFVKEDDGQAAGLGEACDITVCNLETKRYTKTYSEIERRVLKALAGNKARFLS